MKIGFIGLGKMGSRMAGKLLSNGFEVFAWNRSIDILTEYKHDNPKAQITSTIEELINSLDSPRIIWIMVSHNAVDEVLAEVKKFASTRDVIVDGGNSFYKDTDKRFYDFNKLGINFMGVGTSGGILAERNGFPFMVGGNWEGYELITPILDSLSKPNGGHEYFGEGGAGHFVKMVHNGIEYGMMQSIGEGFEILEKSAYKIDLPKVASLWKKGTIVSGFLMDRASEMFQEDPVLDSFRGVVARSGEGDWTLQAAYEEKVEAPSIAVAVDYRKRSEDNKFIINSMTTRVLNALRKSFGGHEVKKD